MNVTTLQTVQQITSQITEKYDPEKIILFGSYASGKAHEDSDIDLCIVADTSDTRTYARNIDRLLFPRLFPIDVLVLTPDDIRKRQHMRDPFVNEILHNGKVLYERSK